jgi:hypothetical protein
VPRGKIGVDRAAARGVWCVAARVWLPRVWNNIVWNSTDMIALFYTYGVECHSTPNQPNPPSNPTQTHPTGSHLPQPDPFNTGVPHPLPVPNQPSFSCASARHERRGATRVPSASRRGARRAGAQRHTRRARSAGSSSATRTRPPPVASLLRRTMPSLC